MSLAQPAEFRSPDIELVPGEAPQLSAEDLAEIEAAVNGITEPKEAAPESNDTRAKVLNYLKEHGTPEGLDQVPSSEKLEEMLASSMRRIDTMREEIAAADTAISNAPNDDTCKDAIRKAMTLRDNFSVAINEGLLEPRLLRPQLTEEIVNSYQAEAKNAYRENEELGKHLANLIVKPLSKETPRSAPVESSVALVEELKSSDKNPFDAVHAQIDAHANQVQEKLKRKIDDAFKKAPGGSEWSAPVAPETPGVAPTQASKSWLGRGISRLRQEFVALGATMKELARRRGSEANEHLPPAPAPIVRQKIESVPTVASAVEVPQETPVRTEAPTMRRYEVDPNEAAAIQFNENFLKTIKNLDPASVPDYLAFRKTMGEFLNQEESDFKGSQPDKALVMNRIMFQALKDEDIDVGMRRYLAALLSERKFIRVEGQPDGTMKITRLDRQKATVEAPAVEKKTA